MEISRENIQKIIEAGVMAPSGENCQPWRFEISDNTITLFNVPERDESLYNFKQYGSLVAHGAAIENMVTASNHFGYEASVQLFPDSQNPNLVAQISLKKTSVASNDLYDAIYRRATNRKPYKTILLTSGQHQSIFAHHSDADVLVNFTENREAIAKLANAASVNEQLVFENPAIHQFFFSHLRTTEKENETLRNGFYIKTLELQPAQAKAMNLLKHWNLLKILNRLAGISKKVASDNAKVYEQSAAMGIIAISSANPENFVRAGRVFQKIWLQATFCKMSMQPITGVLFFMRNIEASQTNGFTKQQIELIKENYMAIQNAFGVFEKPIALLFRVGDGGEPTARSPRMAMEKFLTTEV